MVSESAPCPAPDPELIRLLSDLDAPARAARNAEMLRLFEEWLSDESGYDEETWPRLKTALDEERRLTGARLLFDE